MSELPRFTIPMPQEDAESLGLETSVISPAEAAKVRSLATLISQTINSMYGNFIPKETIEANHDIGNRVIVTDDIITLGKAWNPGFREPVKTEGLAGYAFQRGGIIAVLNPEIDWGRCCPHCKAKDIEALGSEPAARELYKRRYYTTFIAHEEVHQYQDWRLPEAFKEMGAYYYTSHIARQLGHRPVGDDLADMRYNAYEALLQKYGDDVHRVFFGATENPITKLRKPFILHEAFKQKDILFPNGQDL